MLTTLRGGATAGVGVCLTGGVGGIGVGDGLGVGVFDTGVVEGEVLVVAVGEGVGDCLGEDVNEGDGLDDTINLGDGLGNEFGSAPSATLISFWKIDAGIAITATRRLQNAIFSPFDSIEKPPPLVDIMG